MELWRQCTHWLIQCRVLPPSHRVTWDGAQVCELAQALRDGVLLCQLLNNLLPQAINLREVNLRPQMSQVRRLLTDLPQGGWWEASQAGTQGLVALHLWASRVERRMRPRRGVWHRVRGIWGL